MCFLVIRMSYLLTIPKIYSLCFSLSFLSATKSLHNCWFFKRIVSRVASSLTSLSILVSVSTLVSMSISLSLSFSLSFSSLLFSTLLYSSLSLLYVTMLHNPSHCYFYLSQCDSSQSHLEFHLNHFVSL